MKKLLLIFFSLILALNIIGCEKEEKDKDSSISRKEKETVNEQTKEETKSDVIVYDEKETMFYGQDRCDIEDDRYVVYKYNYKGELLKATENETIGYYAENGLAPAIDLSTYKMGYVDKDGVFVIPPKYDGAYSFSSDGVALVEIEIDSVSSKYGYINSKGEEIVPCIYDKASSFYENGYAIIGVEFGRSQGNDESWESKEYMFGVIDKTGKVIIEPKYKIIRGIYDNYIQLNSSIIDFQENVLDKVPNSDVLIENDDVYILSKNVATTTTGYAYGIEKDGNTVVPYVYDAIYENDGPYYVCVKNINGDRWNQVIDIYNGDFEKTAETLDYPFEYMYKHMGTSFPQGYFKILVDNDDYEWTEGVIDYQGNIIVEPVFGRGINYMNYYSSAYFPIVDYDWNSEEEMAINPGEIKVIHALNYTTPDGNNTIKLPKITSTTENVKKFNEKIYATFENEYNRLLNDKEGNQIFSCDYKYRVNNGIIGIAIDAIVGVQQGGVSEYYYTFYYDTNNDRELTFDEYIAIFGISKDELLNSIKNTSSYKNYLRYSSSYDDTFLFDCIFDWYDGEIGGGIAYIYDYNSMSGYHKLEIGY